MASAKTDPRYRLVVFDEIDEPEPVRDLFCKVTGLHAADAMLWIAKTPGAWPHALTAEQTRALLDGLYDLGVAAEAWLVDKFPDLNPVRTIHDAACLPEGFRVKGLRGEPTHWVPWPKVELICAGRIEAEDEFRTNSPPRWPSAIATGLRALTLRKPRPAPRLARASRVIRDPVGEVVIVRSDPRVAFRVVENQMNYAYLGDALRPSAAENFPKFVADLVARADDAMITPSTKAFLQGPPPRNTPSPRRSRWSTTPPTAFCGAGTKRDRNRALDGGDSEGREHADPPTEFDG
ncbi:MAG: hypothetical protein U0835_13040 [Isosphaeraceae bacterium]